MNRIKRFIKYLLLSFQYLIWRLLGLAFHAQEKALPSNLNGLKILMIHIHSIGDILMATPAIRELKNAYPRATIDMLISWKTRELLEYNPNINYLELLSGKLRNLILFYKLRKRRYDITIDFSAVFPSAWIAFAIGGIFRAGFRRDISLGFFKINNFKFLYTYHTDYSEDSHLIQQNLKLVKNWLPEPISLKMDFIIAPKSIDEAEMMLSEFDTSGKQIIAIHPSAKWPPKRWPVKKFAVLIEKLQEIKGVFPLLIDGPKDSALIKEISHYSDAPVKTITCRNLMVLASVIKESVLLVCNDSGPMHIAASVGTPTVSLFGPVSPKRSRPLDPIHTVVYKGLYCSPCLLYYSRDKCMRGKNYCMEEIDVMEVMDKIYKCLSYQNKKCQ